MTLTASHVTTPFKGTAIPVVMNNTLRTKCCIYNQQYVELRLTTKVNYVCHIHYTRPPRIHHIRREKKKKRKTVNGEVGVSAGHNGCAVPEVEETPLQAESRHYTCVGHGV
jgi:hypothetical protein